MAEEIPLRLESFQDVDGALASKKLRPGWGLGANLSLTEGTLVNLVGSNHLERRRAYSPLFTRRRLAFYDRNILLPAIQDQIGALLDDAVGEEHVTFDLLDFSRFAFAAVGARLTGIDGAEGADDRVRLIGYLKTLSDGFALAYTTRDREELMAEVMEAQRAYRVEFFEPSLAHRSGVVQEDTDPEKDLISLWLAAQLGDTGALLRESILVLTAVVNSPTRVLPHVVAEMFGWFDANPSKKERITDEDYIRRSFYDAHRLHPRGPAKPYRALADVELPSGRTLDQDVRLQIDLAAAGRDPDAFGPSPTSFDPNREGPSMDRLVFGYGTHTCIGKTLTVGAASHDGQGSSGMIIRLIEELFRVGLSPASHPPVASNDTVEDNFASFPVRISRQLVEKSIFSRDHSGPPVA